MHLNPEIEADSVFQNIDNLKCAQVTLALLSQPNDYIMIRVTRDKSKTIYFAKDRGNISIARYFARYSQTKKILQIVDGGDNRYIPLPHNHGKFRYVPKP